MSYLVWARHGSGRGTVERFDFRLRGTVPAERAPKEENAMKVRIVLCVAIAVSFGSGNLGAQQTRLKGNATQGSDSRAEPTDINGPSEVIVAAVRSAWRSVLAPDESWIATGYGQNAG